MNHYENLLSMADKNYNYDTGLTNNEKFHLDEAVNYIMDKCYEEAGKGFGSALIELKRTNFATGAYYSIAVNHKKLLISKLKYSLNSDVEIHAKKCDRDTPVIFGGDDSFNIEIKWRV